MPHLTGPPRLSSSLARCSALCLPSPILIPSINIIPKLMIYRLLSDFTAFLSHSCVPMGRTPFHQARALSWDNTTGSLSQSRPRVYSEMQHSNQHSSSSSCLFLQGMLMPIPSRNAHAIFFLRRAEIRNSSKTSSFAGVEKQFSADTTIPGWN